MPISAKLFDEDVRKEV